MDSASGFSGSMVAIATPFSGGEVDLDAFSGLIEWHLASGTNGLVVCGTTGEAATLSVDEKTVFRES